MRENITKVAERGERLDQLQDKTGAPPSLVASRPTFGLAVLRLRAVLTILLPQTTSPCLHKVSVGGPTGSARCVLPPFAAVHPTFILHCVQNMWWKDMKMRIIIGVAIAIIIIIIVVSVVKATHH